MHWRKPRARQLETIINEGGKTQALNAASVFRSDPGVSIQALQNPQLRCSSDLILDVPKANIKTALINSSTQLTSRNVQKSCATRTPQELSTRGAKHLTADLSNVYLQLPH